MGIKRRYLRLFHVSAIDQDTGAALPIVKLRPTAAGAALLARHQLVYRERDAGFEVYYQTNPDAAEPLLGKINGHTRFEFQLNVSSKSFVETYLTDLTAETGRQLHLENLTAAGGIQPMANKKLTAGNFAAKADATRVVPRIFHERVDMDDAPTEFLFLKRHDNAVVLHRPIKTDRTSGLVPIQVNLSQKNAEDQDTGVNLLPPGGYRLKTDAAGAATKNIYLDDTLAGQDLQGLVAIHLDKAQDQYPAGGLEFQIPFKAA